ncbi:MAG: hypothetical protein GF392_03530 [Candidatus Omnitrophica bacterium]|nr:hypothetical protein [Candidatus Omnitrophota bacterium]
MISRERLLAGLKELIYVEEGITAMLTNFTKGVMEHAQDLPPDDKRKITKLLTRLYSDSQRHWETVEDMTRKIESEDRDEY